jgi:riboflavin kinase / FMN adenylyltransferase
MTAPADATAPEPGCVVTVGTYDGVHLGHRRLIAEARAEAAISGLRSVVVTFDRHPAEVLRPEAAPRLLTGLEHKLELLDSTGIDRVVVLHFDEERAAQSAKEFVEDFLVGVLGARSVLVGSNFRFGHRQQGDIALLESLGPRLGFTARGMDLVTEDATESVVSSARIRALVAAGELGAAGRLLGRPHEVRGELAAVDEAGATVAISPSLLLPPPGAYTVRFGPVHSAGIRAVASVSESCTTVEVRPAGPTGPASLGVRVGVVFLGPRH